MKIIFFMAHPGFSRNFDHPIRELARRGHEVHIAFDRVKKRLADQNSLIESLAAEFPNVTYGRTPGAAHKSLSSVVGNHLRLDLDYLRYLEPPFEHADKLRDRAAQHASKRVRRLAGGGGTQGAARRRRLSGILRLAERSVPVRQKVTRYIERAAPDVIVVTPLVELGSPQTNYVRAARRLGIRSMLCVASWDNLTTKGLIHEAPADVFVWNHDQAREAVELHGMSEEAVFVAGAWSYDHWFAWKPSGAREQFCRDVGLDPSAPFVSYLGSSEFIAPNEAAFAVRWLTELRAASSDDLRGVGVLIRPHPTNSMLSGQDGERLRELIESTPNAVIWPRDGVNPTSTELRTQYFDSLYHASAVVGINTSGLVESAILGKPVLTVRAPEYRETQEGTLHFAYLAAADDGFLRVANTFEEHHRQLAAALDHTQVDARTGNFVSSFIRPRGIDRVATTILVDEIERRAALPVRQVQRGVVARIVWPIVVAFHVGMLSDILIDRAKRFGFRLATDDRARRVLRRAPFARHVARRLLVRDPGTGSR